MVEIGLASQDMARRELVDVNIEADLESSVGSSEMGCCSATATVALGAKTPALDTAELFAATSERQVSLSSQKNHLSASDASTMGNGQANMDVPVNWSCKNVVSRPRDGTSTQRCLMSRTW